MATRGIRNNNPGNIRGSYYGATGTDSSGFAQYGSMAQGIRAISSQLNRYYTGAMTGTPIRSIRGIITTWAPPNENNTQDYIATVASKLGVTPDQTVNLDDINTRSSLIKAIIDVENGSANTIDREQIKNALAGNETDGKSDTQRWIEEHITKPTGEAIIGLKDTSIKFLGLEMSTLFVAFLSCVFIIIGLWSMVTTNVPVVGRTIRTAAKVAI